MFALDYFPLALPMGWVESPPYFTVFTETAYDTANVMLSSRHESRLNQVLCLVAVAAGISLSRSHWPPILPLLVGQGDHPLPKLTCMLMTFCCWPKRVASTTESCAPR